VGVVAIELVSCYRQRGMTPEMPAHTPAVVKHVTSLCWNITPADRADLPTISKHLAAWVVE
jgi:hypothetical protein